MVGSFLREDTDKVPGGWRQFQQAAARPKGRSFGWVWEQQGRPPSLGPQTTPGIASMCRTGAHKRKVLNRSGCRLPWNEMDNSVVVVKLVDQNGPLRG